MSKRQVLMIIGVWIAVFLFLGFPSGGEELLAVISGVILVAVAYRLREADSGDSGDNVYLPFSEHKSESSTTTDSPPTVSSVESGPDDVTKINSATNNE